MAKGKRVKIVGTVSVMQSGGRRVPVPCGEYQFFEISASPVIAKADKLTMLGKDQLPVCKLRSDDGREYELPFEDYVTYSSSGAIKETGTEREG